MSDQLLPQKPKSLTRLQTRLIELKTTLSLLSEVLAVFEHAFVQVVCFALTLIGAMALLSFKIDLPRILETIANYLER